MNNGVQMIEKQIYDLEVDEDFKQLIPSLGSNEKKQLEENLLKDGCREPLCVWGKIIIDGHNRYEICTRLKISFHIQQIDFNNRDEIIAWICANQLGRRNISEETRRYLIGKRYETEKKLGTRNPSGKNQHSEKKVKGAYVNKLQTQQSQRITAIKLGGEYRIHERTVRKYGKYAKTIDTLAEKKPEIISEILAGKIKMSYNDISKFTNQSTEIVKNAGNKLTNNDFKSKVNKKITVKDMPAYDRDAEISSLTLTIPSWVSSINRTLSIANFDKTSSKAKIKLQNELKNLEYTINVMLLAVEEK